MKRNTAATSAALALCISLATTSTSPASETPGPLATAVDAVVVRPACLVATVVGTGFFVVALPFSLTSKSVKRTADMLITKPAKATFTRPMGDLDALSGASAYNGQSRKQITDEGVNTEVLEE